MTQPVCDEFEVRRELIAACERAGSQTIFAADNGLSKQYVGDIVHGRKSPGRLILQALGFEAVTRYIRKPAITSGESPRITAGLVP